MNYTGKYVKIIYNGKYFKDGISPQVMAVILEYNVIFDSYDLLLYDTQSAEYIIDNTGWTETFLDYIWKNPKAGYVQCGNIFMKSTKAEWFKYVQYHQLLNLG